MKRIYKISKAGLLATFVGLLMLTSCKDELPGPLDTSSKVTELKSIKLINTGANGDIVLEGTVDEVTKMVSFPRVDPETDFNNLIFDAELSDGSKLDKESYQITFGEGEASNTIGIRVVSEPRYREYIVTLRLKIPVFGADFTKPTIFDYSANVLGNPSYPSFVGMSTRGTGFDGQHVLVIDRGPTGPHLLKVEDLKNNVINRIPLNVTGVASGTLTMNMGAQVNGHSYIVSLSGGNTSPLKIYHWTNPSAAPEVVLNLLTGSVADAGNDRYGDNVSFNLDDQGNGYIFFVPLAGTKILRLSVANYTNISSPVIFTSPTAYGQWSSYLRVGDTESYLVTAYNQPISIMNGAASRSYLMKAPSVPTGGTDARVITFNGERYLMMITTARTGTESSKLYLYNITRGETISEALTLFEQDGGARPFVYEYTLTTTTNIAPASQTGWLVKKDEKGKDETLVLYAAHTDAGFVIIELPKSIAED